MAPAPASALAINVGSSTIKFAVYQIGRPLKPLLYGKLDRIDVGGTTLAWHSMASGPGEGRMEMPDRESGTGRLLDWLEARQEFASVRAVGHRVVHGMGHMEAAWAMPEVVAELHRATPYAPDHLPRELELIEAFRTRYPGLRQVPASTPRSTAACRRWRGCCRFRGAFRRKACNGTGFMVCPTRTFWRSWPASRDRTPPTAA